MAGQVKNLLFLKKDLLQNAASYQGLQCLLKGISYLCKIHGKPQKNSQKALNLEMDSSKS